MSLLQGLDIGPDSVRTFSAALHGCRCVLWNGPMGVFEWDRFAHGTIAIAKAIAALTPQVRVRHASRASIVLCKGVLPQVLSCASLSMHLDSMLLISHCIYMQLIGRLHALHITLSVPHLACNIASIQP